MMIIVTEENLAGSHGKLHVTSATTGCAICFDNLIGTIQIWPLVLTALPFEIGLAEGL